MRIQGMHPSTIWSKIFIVSNYSHHIPVYMSGVVLYWCNSEYRLNTVVQSGSHGTWWIDCRYH